MLGLTGIVCSPLLHNYTAWHSKADNSIQAILETLTVGPVTKCQHMLMLE